MLSRTALLLGVLLILGCNDGPQMDYSSIGLVDAHGVVTLDGQPLEGAVITFESPEGDFSYGMTDAQGAYQLNFDSEMQGVAPGPKTVRISTTRKILGLNTDDAEIGDASEEEGAAVTATAPEKVPAKYNRDSQLSVDVTSDRTEYNFDLQSA